MGLKNSKIHRAMMDIVGVWYNRVTKNSCCFYAMKNPQSFGVMDFFQFKSKSSVKFKYRIIEMDDVLYLDIEDNRFEILELYLEPEAILSIKTADKAIISLYKDSEDLK